MVLSFKDGTRMSLPNSPRTNSFLQFDLPWLIYVHGKVTSFDSQNESSSFSVQLPQNVKAEKCFFC
jgi:hypothetical protein